MKEDVKAKLKAKVVGDEELDNVAGGTNDQNMEILGALEAIDPDGVKEVYNAMGNVGGDYAKMGNIAAGGVYNLVNKNLGLRFCAFSSANDNNTYTKDGRAISHNDLLNEIKKKAAGADDFVVM